MRKNCLSSSPILNNWKSSSRATQFVEAGNRRERENEPASEEEEEVRSISGKWNAFPALSHRHQISDRREASAHEASDEVVVDSSAYLIDARLRNWTPNARALFVPRPRSSEANARQGRLRPLILIASKQVIFENAFRERHVRE